MKVAKSHDTHSIRRIVAKAPEGHTISRHWCDDCEQPIGPSNQFSDCERDGCTNRPANRDMHGGREIAVCDECVSPEGEELPNMLTGEVTQS